MARSRKEDTKTKAERLQTILRLVQEHPISRQEVLLEHLRNEGFEVTQATVSPRYPGAVPCKGSHHRGLPLCFQPERKLQSKDSRAL